METLKELRAKYKQLKNESDNICNQIKILERKEILSNFIVGDCYLDIVWNNLMKIVSISDNYIYYICLDNASITRDNIYIYDTEDWVKITSEQFKDAYLAVMKDIRDPDLEDETESNWDRTLKSIVNSINN